MYLFFLCLFHIHSIMTLFQTQEVNCVILTGYKGADNRCIRRYGWFQFPKDSRKLDEESNAEYEVRV